MMRPVLHFACSVVTALFFCGMAGAEELVSDSFDSASGAAKGRAVEAGDAQWKAQPQLVVNESGQLQLDASEGKPAGSAVVELAGVSLPVTLEATVTIGGDKGSIYLGFANTDSLMPNADPAKLEHAAGGPYMQVLSTGHQLLFPGPGLSEALYRTAKDPNNKALPSGTHVVELTVSESEGQLVATLAVNDKVVADQVVVAVADAAFRPTCQYAFIRFQGVGNVSDFLVDHFAVRLGAESDAAVSEPGF
jgi:hypothetical protein